MPAASTILRTLVVLVLVALPAVPAGAQTTAAPAPVSAPAPAAAPTAPAQIAAPGTGTPAAVTAPGTSSTGAPDDGAVTLLGNGIYQPSLQALTMLFVLAVLLESAFATLFNWRVFLVYFDQRGIKTIVMVCAAFFIVWQFGLDIVASTVEAYKEGRGVSSSAVTSDWGSKLVTALILAGGSAGVFNILVSLGLRTRQDEASVPRPASGKAWLAIRVKRARAVGPIEVKLRDCGSPPPNGAPAAVAGVIVPGRPRLASLLFRNANRFPANNGYLVETNRLYEITVEGKDTSGSPVTGLVNAQYVFAEGAIVDIDVTM